ncbi:MAG TPA: hypothetical protein VJ227_03165 [Patescibacteria group bacterium]|nr:hypothetical protein [Patescibacteria group bacterium]
MQGKIKTLFYIFLISLVPTLIIWLPFALRLNSFWGIPLPQNGMATIVANYDGPLYLAVAKTFYNKAMLGANFQFPLPNEYYAAHFPLFPLLIKLVGLFTNYPYAMLLVTLASSILALYFFYLLIGKFVEKKDALFLTLLFSVFPARWLIVRSVGSADPLFVAGVIASIYYFREKKYTLSGIWGAVATLTKSPGILLFVSYFVYFVLPFLRVKIDLKKMYPLFFIPGALLGVFILYWIVQGNFLAYFNSGDNIHLIFPPFSIFNFSAPWVGTFWLEEVIFVYLIGAVGVVRLFGKKEYEIAAFAAVFFTLSLFVAHRDIIRYSLPLVPFLYVAFSDVLIKKEIKVALYIIFIPLFLFSLAFISQNVMPIANWGPFL